MGDSRAANEPSALYFALTAACEAVSRLAFPAALLGIARGGGEATFVASLLAAAASGARSWVAHAALARATRAVWSRAVRAARARSVAELRAGRDTDANVALLLEGVQDEANHVALVVPQTVGLGVASVGLLVRAGFTFEVREIAAALLVAGLAAAAVALLSRSLRRVRGEAWASYQTLAADARVLLEASLELRAVHRERAWADRVEGRAAAFARLQGEATAAGLRIALVPASLALLVVATPLRPILDALELTLAGSKLFEATVLGGATIGCGLAAARTFEMYVTTLPPRARFRAFEASAEARRTVDASERRAPDGSVATLPVDFDGFAHAWSDDGVETPGPFTWSWPPRSGLALLGPNGAGKSTAMLALLGLFEPTRGSVKIGGRDARRVAFGDRVGYVAQDPFLVPNESIAWHCRLHDDVDDATIDDALTRVGLTATLESRARARGVAVRDLPAGELSGGEKRRLALARAVQLPREIYMLDEPEASLDEVGRGALVTLLQRLTERSRVVVVTQDESTIPATFHRLTLMRNARSTPSPTG